MPPSTDDLPGRKPPERRARRGGGRKPGKQPGAPGAYLAWSQDPDTIVDHFPRGRCMCGADLSGAADLGVRYSHQVTDLPEARAETVQHDRHEVRCACGQVHVADAPAEAAGAPVTVTYGLNFQAWCVFLLVMHHIPVERCADIIESMSGTRPSDGWVHSLLERAAQAVAAANMAIRALILLARVVCGDETPVRVGHGRRYFRSWTSTALDGQWTPLADTEANPFIRSSNVTFAPGVTPWTQDFSHGEMIRSGVDQNLTIDPCHLQFLYQGEDPSASGDYSQLPWRLGLLTQTNSTC
jgi:Glycosyl hydrolase family 62/Transposase IS66 family